MSGRAASLSVIAASAVCGNARGTASAAPVGRGWERIFPARRDFFLRQGDRGLFGPPTQQRTCLWPSWLRNDVKRSGNRSGRWFVRPFRQLTPAVLLRRALSQRRPGAMTPKIARFLAQQQPATPCLVLDVDRVEENFRALQRALPLARIYYAVKANPARPILERLVGLGSNFDAASWEEVSGCLEAGARPEVISFGNTIKKAAAIRAAFERGVTLFAFDSAEELQKLAVNA